MNPNTFSTLVLVTAVFALLMAWAFIVLYEKTEAVARRLKALEALAASEEFVRTSCKAVDRNYELLERYVHRDLRDSVIAHADLLVSQKVKALATALDCEWRVTPAKCGWEKKVLAAKPVKKRGAM